MVYDNKGWKWHFTKASSVQCGGVLAFHLLGPLPSPLPFSFHLLFYFGAFLSEAVLVTVTLTRIFIVYQVTC